MLSRLSKLPRRIRMLLEHLRTGPQAYFLLPALLLTAYWFGGELVLTICALTLPILFAFMGPIKRPMHDLSGGEDMPSEQEALIEALDLELRIARKKGLKSACMFVLIDDHGAIVDRFGHDASQRVTHTTVERLRKSVRRRDQVFPIEDDCIAIAFGPVYQFDLDAALGMAARLQAAVEEPVSIDAAVVYVSASIGFCVSSQLSHPSGEALAKATGMAMQEAKRHAPSAIRSYTSELREPRQSPTLIQQDAITALECGQIISWFQPQISTDTGQISGFEALARWMHPERGIIPPSDFLSLLADGAKLGRLGEIMLQHALNAITSWDMQGLNIPRVSVNFSPDELRDPTLLERVKWELDRFDLTPERLVVEILENVVATSPDDTVARNINGLAALGCAIDLDDFGTGHASISSIRRFAVQRLKIDRSFVMKVDQDPEQQRMVSAILLMAERLGLDTLAEGVETAGEHNMLAQLGCRHVQGFGLARPMPFEKTAAWITEHNGKLSIPPIISRKSG